ncbi:MAG TPA: type II toxin-antitoxin system VapC family toxin [Gaiella sp.]
MTLYFDSSAVAKLLLAEDGSERVRELWAFETTVVSSWITYVETTAAIAAAERSGRISPRTMREALTRLRSEWAAVEAIDVDDSTSAKAASLAVRHGLRGMDAIHLASAVLLAEAEPVVVTWDVALHRAAQAEGLAVSV